MALLLSVQGYIVYSNSLLKKETDRFVLALNQHLVMNTEHFEKLLRKKERELRASLAALGGEARASGESEVRDSTDDATSSQGTSESLGEGALMSQTLEQVQDALQRIKDGVYGKCVVCGRQIEAVRLEAIPWTRYCLDDQEKQDRKHDQN
jgi:RNA polymerase-binding transcription factor